MLYVFCKEDKQLVLTELVHTYTHIREVLKCCEGF
jgi:hypothetical protein